MEPMLDEFEAVAATVAYYAPRIDLVSNLTGQFVSGPDINAAYLRRHLRQPVRFAESMALLYERGYRIFLEASPMPTLLSMGERCLQEASATWLPSLRKGREDWQQILQSLAALYTLGVPVDWNAFEAGFAPPHRQRRLNLPTYPFQRQRYWLEMKPPRHTPAVPEGHPLLGRRLRSPVVKETVFEAQLDPRSLPFLADHQVLGLLVVPATAYVEMALVAAVAAFGPGVWTLKDTVIHEALILASEESRPVQLVLSGQAGEATYQIFSLRADSSSKEDWQLHAGGTIVREQTEQAGDGPALERIQERCRNELAIDNFYEGFDRRGIAFGPAFRGVAQVWRGEDESLGRIQLPAALNAETAAYQIHPALLDACWQALAALWDTPELAGQDTYMPVGVDSFRFYRRPGRRLWSHARLRPQPPEATRTGASAETITGDLWLYDEGGQLVAEVEGLRARRATLDSLRRALRGAGSAETWREWLYEVQWTPQALPALQESQPAGAAGPVRLADIAGRLHSRAAALEDQLGLAGAAELLPQLDALSVDFVLLALQQLGWPFAKAGVVTFDALVQATGVVAKHHALLRRILAMLVEAGFLQTRGEAWEVVAAPPVADPAPRLASLEERYPAYAGEIALFGRSAARLAEVLRGEVDPLELLFAPGARYTAEHLYGAAPTAQMFNTLLAEAAAGVIAGAPPGRKWRILEIGAGTGGSTGAILPLLPREGVEYTFTDVSNLFLVKAKEKFGRHPFIEYRLLDIERDPASQGFAPESFDLIIAANVLHATGDLRQTLAHVRQLLSPGGALALLEGAAPRRWIDLTFGLTPGWWKFNDKQLRPAHPLLSPPQWRRLLAESGFGETAAVPGDEGATMTLFPQAILLANARQTPVDRPTENWLICGDGRGAGAELAGRLREQGVGCALVTSGERFARLSEDHWQLNPAKPEEFRQLLAEVAEKVGAPAKVVHMWSLDVAPGAEFDACGLDAALTLATGSALHLAQALAGADLPLTPRLWLVTEGVQAIGTQGPRPPAQAPVWGLGRIIALEHPELYGGCLDLDPGAGSEREQLDHLLAEIERSNGEQQLAFRAGARYVARLVRRKDAGGNEPPVVKGREPVRLEVTSPGILDSLELRPLARRAPGPGEVEVEVVAAGLNFRDVLSALGLYPGDAGPLGGECAGRISAVGEGVSEFAVDDEVIAIAPGSLGSFVVIRREKVFPKPSRLTFVEAATVLSAFMTATYTLHHLAGMRRGERVLIHAAAGGVGMAAVQLAQRAGAEIFATAGSPEKRARLRSLGVHHVMNSRTLEFADEIRRITGGRGVDVVLNSLADDFIPHSLSVLTENGRFLEIGKRGIWTAGQVAELYPRVAYHVIDLVAKMEEDPALIQQINRQIIDLVEAGELTPLPHQVFPLEEAATAFRTMAQAKHVGKIVITYPPTGAATSEPTVVRADAAYLITGGLTGLGILTAQRLVAEGARHLVLLGRRAPSETARKAIQTMEQAGARVMTFQADVADEARLKQLLADIANTMPPLRGVIHSAGVLDDGALLQQNWARFQTVFAPKVTGGHLLHTLTRHLPLDFFILFSSASAVLGSPGQSNHAAANAFLDALAHYRRGQGLPALSINWGAWGQIGAAAERSVDERVSARGIGAISPEEGWQALWHLMQRSPGTTDAPAQVGVFPVDWTKFLALGASPFFNDLAAIAPAQSQTADAGRTRANGHHESGAGAITETAGIRQRLAEAPASKRRPLILAFVRDEAQKVLGLPPGQTIDQQQPLQELGLDSLMAVELRNLLGSRLELDRPLPATLVFDYPSVESLASYLMNELFGRELDKTPAPVEQSAERDKKVAELEALSEDEAEALLLAELAAMKRK
jgi:NADPH:quinone reductase-like Zn-dependent oxidoreductase/SAM-dependent methyltransferase